MEKGDIVTVEASPGHDIGTVSLTGKLVLLQMKKENNVRTEAEPWIYRRQNRPISKYEGSESKGTCHYDSLAANRSRFRIEYENR